MKFTIAIFAVALASLAVPAFAEDVLEPIPDIIETLNIDGSTNTWTHADLIQALGLMNRKFHRDVATPNGRVAWHGRLVSQIIDTNRLVKIETYADGSSYEFPFSPPTPPSPKPPVVDGRGVPEAVKRARERRRQEKATTNIVDIVITPDGKEGPL